jgi:hypothetical protein
VVVYSLMDAESSNMVGRFGTRREALAAVAGTARRHGPESDEVLSLVLFRDDGPPDAAYVAQGAALVRLALAEATGQVGASRPRATPAG